MTGGGSKKRGDFNFEDPLLSYSNLIQGIYS